VALAHCVLAPRSVRLTHVMERAFSGELLRVPVSPPHLLNSVFLI
jgi:hypothetical protein